jgi:hypothetical protein
MAFHYADDFWLLSERDAAVAERLVTPKNVRPAGALDCRRAEFLARANRHRAEARRAW